MLLRFVLQFCKVSCRLNRLTWQSHVMLRKSEVVLNFPDLSVSLHMDCVLIGLHESGDFTAEVKQLQKSANDQNGVQ